MVSFIPYATRHTGVRALLRQRFYGSRRMRYQDCSILLEIWFCQPHVFPSNSLSLGSVRLLLARRRYISLGTIRVKAFLLKTSHKRFSTPEFRPDAAAVVIHNWLSGPIECELLALRRPPAATPVTSTVLPGGGRESLWWRNLTHYPCPRASALLNETL